MSAIGRAAEQALIFTPTIQDFVDGRHTADVFEKAYLTLVKRTPGMLEEEVSEIVNGLFGDVDAYVAEERLRGDDDLDAAQLLVCATGALEKLRQLSGGWMMTEHKRSVEAMLTQYREVIESFVQQKISADDFETEYLRTFTTDKCQVQGSEFITLEKLFFDVDDYVSDPALRDSPGDLSGEQLRERAAATYSKLFGRE